MKKRDKLGSFIDENTASSNINDLILNDGIYDPHEIAKILLERGIESNMKKGYWTSKAENKIDIMMNRVLSHIKFIRDEKKRANNVRTRMKNAGYGEQEIYDRIEWVCSVVPEPKEYCRSVKQVNAIYIQQP